MKDEKNRRGKRLMDDVARRLKGEPRGTKARLMKWMGAHPTSLGRWMKGTPDGWEDALALVAFVEYGLPKRLPRGKKK